MRTRRRSTLLDQLRRLLIGTATAPGRACVGPKPAARSPRRVAESPFSWAPSFRRAEHLGPTLKKHRPRVGPVEPPATPPAPRSAHKRGGLGRLTLYCPFSSPHFGRHAPRGYGGGGTGAAIPRSCRTIRRLPLFRYQPTAQGASVGTTSPPASGSATVSPFPSRSVTSPTWRPSSWPSPRGTNLLTGGDAALARLWDAATGRPSGPRRCSTARGPHATFSPRVLIPPPATTTRRFGGSTGAGVPRLSSSGGCQLRPFSPNGLIIATARLRQAGASGSR